MQEKGSILKNLYRLPKHKEVLDFVLSSVTDQGSPEKYELTQAILNMYLTSAGFNPEVFLKTRYKKLKSSTSKSYLIDLDNELSRVIGSEQYIKLSAGNTNFRPLFNEFIHHSEGILHHPATSMVSDADEFLKKLYLNQQPELALMFYHNHKSFFELILMNGDHKILDEFNSTLNAVIEKADEFRFAVKLIEIGKLQVNGNEADTIPAAEFFYRKFKATDQKDEKYKYLLQYLRLLTPGKSIIHQKECLEFASGHADEITGFHPVHSFQLFNIIAFYATWLTHVNRTGYLLKAGAPDQNNGKAKLRLTAAVIAADEGNFEKSLKHLNECEYQLYNSSFRDPEMHNLRLWLGIYRIVIITLERIIKNEICGIEPEEVIQSIHENSLHRIDRNEILNFMNGFRYLYHGEIKNARGIFNDLLNSPNVMDHLKIVSEVIFKLSDKSIHPVELKSLIKSLQQSRVPFFSSCCIELAKFHQKKKRKPVPAITEKY